MPMQRQLITLHLYLAAFFLPIALMFAATGGLYTVSIKGQYEETAHQIAIPAPLEANLPALTTLAAAELERLGIAVPTGAAGLRKAGTSFELEWTGVERDIALRPTTEPLIATLVVKETTPWRHLVQLHKAKGSDLAKVISVLWAIGLVLILASGMTMALNVPIYRRKALWAGAAGMATFVIYALLG
jgi:hypothetical protein